MFIVYKLSTTKATTNTLPYDKINLKQMYGAIFDPIVKPEMRDSWNINMKKWFVLSDSVHDQLYPGKLKCELKVKFFSPELF